MPRFNDNQDGTITDSETSLTWQKKDSRQLTGRWMHLEKSQKLGNSEKISKTRKIPELREKTKGVPFTKFGNFEFEN